MQVFVRVVEHGAFTRAADALGISRASATAAVAGLEKQIGVRLLHRTTRRLSVTEEGQSYYNSCVRILGEIAEADEAVSGTRLVPRGRLRVSIPQSFMDTIFYPALARFLKEHPQLELEVVLTDRAVNMIEEGIDCAMRGLEIPSDSGLVARTLSVSRWLTCASPAYLHEHGTPRNIGDLAGHDCIRFISQSTGRPRDWQFDCDGKSVSMVPNGKLRLTSFEAATLAASEGCGIAQVPDGLGIAAVLAGRLQPILTDHVAVGCLSRQPLPDGQSSRIH
jgi:LysR family transcriptional regulator for bpeEF and oprC